MGLLIMIISMLLGIFLIAMGIFRGKYKYWRIMFILFGIIFIFIAVYLGLPK